MEDIKAKQQKLPIDRVAEKNIYEELKAQYDSAKQTGYGYRHESDLDAIFSRQAGILAAGGLKSVYDIGTRPVERSSVIEVGSRRPDYQYAEPKETINNVYKRGDNYYYEAGDDEGAPFPIKIDPARILDVQEDVKTRRQSGEDESDYVYYSGIKIRVKDDPRIEVINKRTNAPVYDVELNYDKWQEDPLAYKLLDKPMEVETNPYRGFNKINTNYSVRGAADLSFQMVPDAQGNQVPLILPIYRSTSTDLTPLIIAGTLLAGGLYFGPGATAGAAGTGAATGATAGTAGAGAATGAAAGTGLTAGAGGVTGLTAGTASTGIGAGAIGTGLTAPAGFTLAPGLGTSLAAGGAGLGLLEGAQFPVEGLQATTSNVPSTAASFATTTAGEGLLAPTVPGLSSMGGAQGLTVPVAGGTISQLGLVPTGAVPALGTDGFFGPSLVNDPNVLGNAVFSTDSLALPAVAGGGAGISALQAVNALGSLLGQPALPLASGGGGGGGGQSRGVDFSPLYQNTLVGLLPLAERYRRSLI
jgi:hypothetical protein